MIKNKDLRNVVFLSFEFFDRKSAKARNLRFTKVGDVDYRLDKETRVFPLWEMRNRGASRLEIVFLGF